MVLIFNFAFSSFLHAYMKSPFLLILSDFALFLFFCGFPGFLGGVFSFLGVFRFFLGVFLVFLGCFWFSWGVPGFLGGVPSFLGVFRVFLGCFWFPWECSGFFGGCSGFFGCSGMFRDVPVFRCSVFRCSWKYYMPKRCLCLKTSLSANLKYQNYFCMQFHFNANQSLFLYKNGFALRVAFKQRHKGTRK